MLTAFGKRFVLRRARKINHRDWCSRCTMLSSSTPRLRAVPDHGSNIVYRGDEIAKDLVPSLYVAHHFKA